VSTDRVSISRRLDHALPGYRRFTVPPVADSLIRVTQGTGLDERAALIVETLVDAFADLMAADADAFRR
jgi:hypothetical protein